MSKTETVSPAELSVFCGQIAMFLEAGMPLYEGVKTLAAESGKSAAAPLYRALDAAMEETGSLTEALQKDARWPEYLVEMVSIGERTGKLEEVMASLSRQYEREDRLRSAISSVIVYPLTLVLLLAAVIVVMLWKVVPVFRRVLGSMGLGAEGSSQTLTSAGTAVGIVVLVLVALLLIMALVLWLLVKTGRKDKVSALLEKLFPAVKRMLQKRNASRLGAVLSMMLSGGFSAEEAVTLGKSVLSGDKARAQADTLLETLSSGDTMANAVEKSGLFDALEVRLFRTASAAGREAETMERISVSAEEQAEAELERLVSIIEPTLVTVLSAIVGGVLLSVMLPMAGILTGML